MAKKADLEAAHARVVGLAGAARTAERDRDFPLALARAVESLPYLRASVAFQRRYLDLDPPPLPAADLVLKYAPPLFARPALDALDTWFTDGKKADRDLFPHLTGAITAARHAAAVAADLWAEIHALTPPRPRTGPAAAAAEAVAAVWVAAGAVLRVGPGRYAPVTELRGDAVGACHGCGRAHRAAYVELLAPLVCPGCGRVHPFAVTGRA